MESKSHSATLKRTSRYILQPHNTTLRDRSGSRSGRPHPSVGYIRCCCVYNTPSQFASTDYTWPSPARMEKNLTCWVDALSGTPRALARPLQNTPTFSYFSQLVRKENSADMEKERSRHASAAASYLFNALNLVLHIHVQLLQLLNLLRLSLPVSSSVGLQEGGDQLSEGVRVGIH